ncbi:MAG TPA: tetratricopeptide repeat protein [Stellaceae bacterium]|nr:tetratricopeptide repeat protein [Stellaceae bacterium]
MRPGFCACIAVLTLCAAPSLLSQRAAGQTALPYDSLSQFETLLQNPNEIAANLAYAQSLQAAGQTDAARQTYRKVLSLDPNNATATAALATLGGSAPLVAGGAQTDYTLRIGGAYESNSPRRPPNFRSFDDVVGFGEFTVNDTRQLGGITLQTNLDLYSNIHNRYSAGDISYFALDTGPIFDLQDAGKLRVALGGEYVLQGQSPIPANSGRVRQFEFDSGNVIFNWFPPGPNNLQSVNLLVGYNNFRDSSSFRSGVVMRLTAPFVFDEVLPIHTQLLVTPGFIYNGADESSSLPLQPAHYNEANIDILTLTPVAEHQLGADRIIAKAGLFADTDYYDSHDPVPTNNRQDVRLIPLVGVRMVGFFMPRLQLDLDYRYDRNFSNDFAQRFEDHIVSLIATIRF